MGVTILVDKVFRIYSSLPHCKISRSKHIKSVRSRFNYTELSDISIMATNCVGGEIYSLLGLKFTSPLINTSMDRHMFVRFCAHLKEYLSLPIKVKSSPQDGCVGILGGNISLPQVSIRFPRDTDPQKIVEDWNRRVNRVNYDKLVLIVDDKGLDSDDYKVYDGICAFRKICLTANDLSDSYTWCHQLKMYEKNGKTGAYNGKSIDGLWKFTKIWDYVGFLNTGKSSMYYV